MNKKEIFRKIGGIIAEITEQYQYLSEDPENINELELELFVANAHFLSDHLVILQKIKSSAVKASPEIAEYKSPEIKPSSGITLEAQVKQSIVAPENSGEKSMISEKNQILSKAESAPKSIFEFENKPIEQLLDQSLTLDELQVLNEKAEIEKEPPAKKEEIEAVPIKEAEALNTSAPIIKEVTLSERTIAIPLEKLSDFSASNAPTINELLSEKSSSNTLASQFSQQPVKDLKSIINLNDKLLFVKDLFKGYSLAYSEAIEFLNRFDSFETADNFLKTNYAAKNSWSEKEATVEKFYEILNRRFAK